MVLVLVVQMFQIIGGIMNLLPCGGDEEIFHILVGTKECWPHFAEVNVKPLLAENERK